MLPAILIVSIFAGLFTGCTRSGKEKETGTNTEDEKITITYFVQFSSNVIQSLEENEVYKELEKRTNIHVDFLHPSGDTNQAFQLLIASNDLPDVIELVADRYPGGPDKAIADGVYYRLNEMIDKYAPNYKKVRESSPEIQRQTITDDGNIWAFASIQTDYEEPWTGLQIRKDWLDELGLPIPTTIDELYIALTAFKNQKGAEVPMTWWDSWQDKFGFLIGAWDIGPEFFKVDEKVKYGPIEPAYKDYLITMNKWYKEGLIDPEFFSRNGDGRATLIANNEVGVFNSTSDKAVAAVSRAMPYVTLVKGDTRRYGLKNFFNKGNEAAITTKCKYPEEVVKWFDYHYSDEGFMLFNYGIEGVSYTMQDGKPVFTDLMLNNPDGYSPSDMSWVYKVHVGPYLRDWRAFPGIDDAYLERSHVWGSTMDPIYNMPPITLKAEEGTEFSTIMSEVKTYVDEMTTKFIIGEVPLENYPQFVENIKKMGIDRAIDLQQQALDRYNNR